MRLLLVHGEGLGNIIEILPLIKTLKNAGHEVDLAISNASFPVPKELFVGQKVYLPGETVTGDGYDGKIVTIWGKINGANIAPGLRILNHLGRQAMRMDQSEVEVYLNIARELGCFNSDFDCRDMIGYRPTEEKYDVVIANGYNWKNADVWRAKGYNQYPEVARLLLSKGITVCSVGAKQEYIPETVDKTGMELVDTLGLVANAKVVVSNDSGIYHCACGMGKKAVVLFTFTSVVKNRDSNFHRTAMVLGRDFKCRVDCHERNRWLACPYGHECQNIPVEDVVWAVEESLRGDTNGKTDAEARSGF